MPKAVSRLAAVSLALTGLATVGVVALAAREMRWARQELRDVVTAGAHRKLAERRHQVELTLRQIEDHLQLMVPLTAVSPRPPLEPLTMQRPYYRGATILDGDASDGAEITWGQFDAEDHAVVTVRLPTGRRLALSIDLAGLARASYEGRPPLERSVLITPRGATLPSSAHSYAAYRDALRSRGHEPWELSAAQSTALGLAAEPHWLFGEALSEPHSEWSVFHALPQREFDALAAGVLGRLSLAAGAVVACLALAAGLLIVVARRGRVLRDRLEHAEHLRHLHEKTEKILDNIPAGVVVLSKSGHVTDVNSYVRERIGRGVVGGPLAALFAHAAPDDLAILEGLLARAQNTGLPQSAMVDLVLFDRPSQAGAYVARVVPLQASTDEAQHLLVIEDLSERKALEAHLLRAEKLATVGVLASGIAHEIGTPLGVVRARAEYLESKLPKDLPSVDGLRIIVEQIDRISRTIRQLLDFARTQPSERAPVSLAAAVRDVGELLRFQLEKRRIKLVANVEADLPMLSANADELQQVLLNLVLNAIDASPEGSDVLVRARRDGPLVRLEVVDRGAGIPNENRHKIFDPFFTTKKRGQGTGLGLSVVAQIVRNHQAEIGLESEAGSGTVFFIRWPIFVAG